MFESVRAGILRVHPDLAGRLASEGRLTTESQQEQQQAGLHDMTTEEKQLMKTLNKRYVWIIQNDLCTTINM